MGHVPPQSSKSVVFRTSSGRPCSGSSRVACGSRSVLSTPRRDGSLPWGRSATSSSSFVLYSFQMVRADLPQLYVLPSWCVHRRSRAAFDGGENGLATVAVSNFGAGVPALYRT